MAPIPLSFYPGSMSMRPKDERTSHAMSRVRQKRTTPEERVAIVLRRLGARYRRNVRTLPGKPDFANQSRGWAVSVHGCFWHQHDCKRGTVPIHNAELWQEKFAANAARDQRVTEALSASGLQVLTIWECETRNPTVLQLKIESFLDDCFEVERRIGKG